MDQIIEALAWGVDIPTRARRAFTAVDIVTEYLVSSLKNYETSPEYMELKRKLIDRIVDLLIKAL